jgi:hypothetical protein
MRAVPCFCTLNSSTSTARVSGTIQGVRASVPISRPSMAESTEIAGVMAPSP